MGIRFRCPNGHTLHVKSFLAGKKAVCPDCGARLRIPSASTIRRDGAPLESGAAASAFADDDDAHEIPPETPAMKSGEDLRDAVQVPKGAAPPQAFTPTQPAVPVATTANVAPTPAPVAQPAQPTANPTAVPPAPAPVRVAAAAHPAVNAAPMGAVPMNSVPVGGVPMGVAPGALPATPMAGAPVRVAAAPVSAVPVGGPARVAAVPVAGAVAVAAVPYGAPPAPAIPAAPPQGRPDPISEAPHAVWYVRPVAGGQYGPARGDIFRQWIGQGRVAPDSLVWREGWGDWRQAASVFPEMQGAVADIALASIGGGAGLSAEQSAAKYHSRRRNSTMFGVGMIVILGLICAALVGVMIFVLSRAG